MLRLLSHCEQVVQIRDVSAAPLFARTNQAIVPGAEMKTDLAALDAYYSAFSETDREQGIMPLAPKPPTDTSFLTTRLWDRFLPAWRQDKPFHLSKEAESEIISRIRRFKDAPAEAEGGGELEETKAMVVEMRIPTPISASDLPTS
jgi:hypothetical protein